MATGGSLAAFVSPHGFGHAARVCGVVEALVAVRPEVRVTIVTTAPEWFFRDSLPGQAFEYRSLNVDVGLVQHDSLRADLPATLAAVDGVVPPANQLVERATALLGDCNADVVLADIAPVGLIAGQAAGVPTVLVENFTWDWIYEPFVAEHVEFVPLIEAAAHAYAGADVHIQTPPVCFPRARAIQVGPIARGTRLGAVATRECLGAPADLPLALVSMGGVEWTFDVGRALAATPAHFVLIGQQSDAVLPDNVTALPHRSRYHHPDLLAAADVMVGKLGYSTVAEAMAQGCPFAYVERTGFAEYDVLTRYVEAHVPTRRLSEGAFRRGEFGAAVRDLATRPRTEPVRAHGGAQVADILAGILPR